MESPASYDPFGSSQVKHDKSRSADAKMCSVLNIVVDHSMEDPTPMEPEEWKKVHQNDANDADNRLQLKVPVLRVFGPLVRHPDTPPLQSTCLHIHGAFPYMLARPVIAGPDGSLLRSSPLNHDNVDWDDAEEVERIAMDIKVILENTLRSLDFSFGDNKKDENGKHEKTRPNRQHPYIRDVTVVEGRGFYSFCPGPAAPFLRIEYYDPKMRWKVKLTLEKGLEVPQRYHPDPRQYDRQPIGDAAAAVHRDSHTAAHAPEDDVLKFHCYEAHIPYTMQFFKDHNLAGMSYIHLRRGRIRGKLANKFFHKNKQLRIPSKGDEEERQKTIDRSVFLHSNTPNEWLWPKSAAAKALLGESGRKHTPGTLHQPSQESSMDSVANSMEEMEHVDKLLDEITSRSEYSPPTTGTSCDIEIDCTTDDIQNVDAIMTTMPSDQEERDKIQWRAVPSLQEIWKEERMRMNKLLSPALTQEVIQDVLTISASPSKRSAAPAFTLNVKENAPRSGARLAVKGMWSLVNVTHGLQEDFVRALSEILERHRKHVDEVDEKLREEREALRINTSGVKNYSPANNEINPQQFQFTSPASHGKEITSVDSQSTPSMNDALDALESLGAAGPGPQEKLVPGLSPSIEDAIEMLDSISQASPGARNILHDHASMLDSSQEIDRLTSKVHSPQAADRIADQPVRSQSLSQQSSVRVRLDELEISQRMDDCDEFLYESQEFIDPEMLVPYDQIELDEDRCRAIFVLGSENSTVQRVCGLRSRTCTRGGHVNAESRAKPGWYKTITTGVIVDGLVERGSFSPGDESEDEEDIKSLERFLSQNDQDPSATLLQYETKSRRRVRFESVLPTQEEEESVFDDQSSDEESTIGSFHDASNDTDTFTMSSTNKTGTRIRRASLGNSRHAPSRRQVMSGVELHRLCSNTSLPDWISHATTYMKMRKDRQQSKYKQIKNQLDVDCLQPVPRAPSRNEVAAWGQKRYRQEYKKTDIEQPRKRLKKSHKAMDKLGFMEIDPNSRQLVANKSGHESVFHSGVEEVGWDMTQQTQLTPSQQCQDFFNVEGKKSQEDSVDALEGIGAQGGRIHVQGGGGLKAKTRHTQTDQEKVRAKADSSTPSLYALPVSIMSVEIHVQCREGVSRLDAKKISLSLDSNKDSIAAITFVYARDPGGGNSIDILQRGCICTSLEGENPQRDDGINHRIQTQLLRSMPQSTMGIASPLSVEVVKNERHILRRFKDIVRMKDPDMMLSWDSQGAGLGYIIERGLALGNANHVSINTPNTKSGSLDMVKLLGRTPNQNRNNELTASSGVEIKDVPKTGQEDESEKKFKGSGLGSDWDDKVGAGAAAASIVGRLVFAGWKIVAEEVKHGNANYQPAIVAAVLNRRIPYHDDMTLAKWYSSGTERWRVLNHRLTQATATLLLFDALDIVGRAGEAARLSGVEFSQSFPGIRGSQYKVEGVLLRALQSLRSDERGSKRGKRAYLGGLTALSQFSSASEESKVSQTQSPWKVRRQQLAPEAEVTRRIDDRQYFFFSPSLEDTNRQEALEVQALTLEPMSGHYTDPVVVCDFTALYPSLVIAYNLCYSTCIGKLEYHSTRREMRLEGRTTGKIGPVHYPERRTATILKHHFKSIAEIGASANDDLKVPDLSRDRGYVSPSGTLYVSEGVLKGVLPQVLDEILTTRAMLKRAAKEYKKGVKDLSPAVLRQLEARQLALKYVANVTYGYTSATFSGRSAMPLLADSIVECGRRTLRKAINIANRWGEGTDAWGRADDRFRGCQVIYGDTDSLFIKMPGRSHKEAFQFGELLCKAVTSLNPPPVQLKLEKVYVGSIMQTMKRYVGMKYDSIDQRKPTFEAKGLETVRRDQCSLTQKVLKNALITLFRHGIEAVREYLHRQWSSILAGNVPVSDFILTGRVRSKYRGGREGPVQAVLARRLAESDPGRIIRHKERLPYVIVATPGVTFRLKDCVLTPLELLERWDAYKIHSWYYIERHVNAALQRCLGLAPHFVKISDWYQACPKPRRRTHFWPVKSKTAMITAYFGNDICSLCNRKCLADGSNQVVVCRKCRRDRMQSIQTAAAVLNSVESAAKRVANECSKCNGCFESADTFAAVNHELGSVGRALNPNNTFFAAPKKGNARDSILLPLANCVCIDCPKTFSRHRLREQGIEALSTYNTLAKDELF